MSETLETPRDHPRQEDRARNQTSLIEAALYVTGKPLDIGVLGSLLNLRSEEKIRKLASALKEKYAQNDGALEVVELSDGRYVMQLKPEYSKTVKRLATRPLLTPGPLKTLSYIALRQPVTQSHVVKVRGNLAYGHVKQLREMGLISDEKLGRSKLLRTTASFSDYFNLSQDPRLMKRQLQQIFEDIKTAQPAAEKSTEPHETPPKAIQDQNVTAPAQQSDVTSQ